MKKLAFITLLVVTLLLTACDNAELNSPIDPADESEYDFTVPKGASTKRVAKLLEEAGLINKSYAFIAAAKKLKLDDQLKAGDYKLKKSMSTPEIVQKIAAGDVYIATIKVTIPEGFEYVQIVDRLEKNGLIDRQKFEDLAENHGFNYRFLEADRNYLHRLEGYLAPATYEFLPDSDELTILTAMLDNFDKNFKDDDYQRAAELGYTVDQIVTLASVIERECVVSDELKKISSVFHNRLNDNYKLEADSTVQYISGERKEKMLNKDIALDTPYNTYKYAGLPPSPICNPSFEAINAALYPEAGKLYFFVVTGDRDGRHNFAETYKEHLKNKREAEAKLKQ